MRWDGKDAVYIQGIQIFLDNAVSNERVIQKDISELEYFASKDNIQSIAKKMMDSPIIREYLESITEAKWDGELYLDYNHNKQTDDQVEYGCRGPSIPNGTRNYEIVIIITITKMSDYFEIMANKLIQSLELCEEDE